MLPQPEAGLPTIKGPPSPKVNPQWVRRPAVRLTAGARRSPRRCWRPGDGQANPQQHTHRIDRGTLPAWSRNRDPAGERRVHHTPQFSLTRRAARKERATEPRCAHTAGASFLRRVARCGPRDGRPPHVRRPTADDGVRPHGARWTARLSCLRAGPRAPLRMRHSAACDQTIHRTLLPPSRCILPSRLGTQWVRARRVSPSGETRSTYGCERGGHALSRTHVSAELSASPRMTVNPGRRTAAGLR